MRFQHTSRDRSAEPPSLGEASQTGSPGPVRPLVVGVTQDPYNDQGRSDIHSARGALDGPGGWEPGIVNRGAESQMGLTWQCCPSGPRGRPRDATRTGSLGP